MAQPNENNPWGRAPVLGWGETPPATEGATAPGGGSGQPPRRPGRAQGYTPKPWQKNLRFGLEALTDAQMRQSAFRARHGFIQGIRYAAGLSPMNRKVLGMYRAETYQNLALNPRQFPGAEEGLEE